MRLQYVIADNIVVGYYDGQGEGMHGVTLTVDGASSNVLTDDAVDQLIRALKDMKNHQGVV